MVAIKNVLLYVAAVSAGVIQERTVQTVLSDLQLINSDTTTLDNSVNAFDGSPSKGVTVQQNFNKVDNDVKTANTNAGKESVFSCTDSTSVINYINNTLEPNIKKTCADTKAKKAQFNALGARDQVKSSLTTLRGDTNTYASTLVSKACSSQVSNANAAKAKVLADLDDAITYFSS